MDLFPTLVAFLLFSSAVVEAGDTALSPELYWHTVLPNTSMPKAIRNLLHSDVETGDPVGFLTGGIPDDNQLYPSTYFDPRMYLLPWSYQNHHHSKAVSAEALMKSPIATLFFLEKDLHVGAKMTLQFQGHSFKATFLPRRMAESIPFSTKKIPEILRYFSIDPTSVESETVANNLEMCEAPPTPRERKCCPTSVESMVDFAASNLGTLDVTLLSTNVGKEGRPKQVYTIAPSGVHKMAGLDIVGCHIMHHPHGLFYCHSTREARAYAIQMEGEDGAVVEAAAVCHMDTSDWNPNYVGVQVLGVNPGTPICHFLPPHHIVWAHNN